MLKQIVLPFLIMLTGPSVLYVVDTKLFKLAIMMLRIDIFAFGEGIFASFVGLLFYVTLKFALAVPWNIVRVLLRAAAFIALTKRVDVFYVVLTGAAISIVLF